MENSTSKGCINSTNAVLSTIAKTGRQPVSRQLVYEDVVYTQQAHKGVLLSHKKNEMLPFVARWMDLENIMLSEVKQRKTNTK